MTKDLQDAARDAMDVWQVLAFRLPMLAMSQTPARRREAERMVAEKAEAAFEGALAWQGYWMRAMLTPWTIDADAAQEATRAWAAPGRKTLRANARRLSARRGL